MYSYLGQVSIVLLFIVVKKARLDELNPDEERVQLPLGLVIE